MALAGKAQDKIITHMLSVVMENYRKVSVEGINTAVGRKLDNLILFVDRNGCRVIKA